MIIPKNINGAAFFINLKPDIFLNSALVALTGTLILILVITLMANSCPLPNRVSLLCPVCGGLGVATKQLRQIFICQLTKTLHRIDKHLAIQFTAFPHEPIY